jgi:hypothetical protein
MNDLVAHERTCEMYTDPTGIEEELLRFEAK